MIYIIVIALLLVLIYWYDIHQKVNLRQLWIVVLWIIFTCIPALSYRMGTDTIKYEDWFNKDLSTLASFSFKETTWEPLFCFSLSLLKTICNNWVFAHFIIIGFINYAIFSFAKRYGKHLFTIFLIYFLLYFYEYNFEPLRQSVAMGIFLLSLPLLENKRWFKYIFISLIAIGFHYGAVVVLLLPFLRNLRFNWLIYTLFALSTVVGSLINYFLFDSIILMSRLVSLSKYGIYIGSAYMEGLNVNGIIIAIVVKLIPLLLALYIINRSKVLNFPYKNALVFLSIFFILLTLFIPLFDRFIQFFGMIQILLYAEALFVHRATIKKRVTLSPLFRLYLFIALSANIFMYYNASNAFGFKNYGRCIPYTSIITKQGDLKREIYLLQ